jgi:hypothetical protein
MATTTAALALWALLYAIIQCFMSVATYGDGEGC